MLFSYPCLISLELRITNVGFFGSFFSYFSFFLVFLFLFFSFFLYCYTASSRFQAFVKTLAVFLRGPLSSGNKKFKEKILLANYKDGHGFWWVLRMVM